MKLLLPLVLIASLVSCTSSNPRRRPTAALPGQVAPATNQGLGYVSGGVQLAANVAHDATDDTIDYGGKVSTRQSRNYQNIAFNSARRADDLALRESKRYTNHVLDTYDDAADFEARGVTRWSAFATNSARRAMGSTKKIYQASVHSYAKSVDGTYWKFWDIFAPEECKPWMVGSKNDCAKCCGGNTKVPGGVWTKDFAGPIQEEPVVADSGKSVGRIMK